MNKANGNTGIIEIHGKQYETVALRVQKFREAHGLDLSLTTEIIHRDESCVVMRALIHKDGILLATGHAEEYRSTSQINKTSALENCETSAIGRALATLGMAGTEFASADELKRAIVDKQPARVANPLTDMKADAFEALPEEQKTWLRGLAADVTALAQENRGAEAYGMIEHKHLTMEEKLALWWLLDSKTRSAVKEAGTQAAMVAKAEKKASPTLQTVRT